jgi:hypothetical protein
MTDEQFERHALDVLPSRTGVYGLHAFCAFTGAALATTPATASGFIGSRFWGWMRNSKAAKSRLTSDCSLLCWRTSAAATGQLGYFPSGGRNSKESQKTREEPGDVHHVAEEFRGARGPEGNASLYDAVQVDLWMPAL